MKKESPCDSYSTGRLEENRHLVRVQSPAKSASNPEQLRKFKVSYIPDKSHQSLHYIQLAISIPLSYLIWLLQRCPSKKSNDIVIIDGSNIGSSRDSVFYLKRLRGNVL